MTRCIKKTSCRNLGFGYYSLDNKYAGVWEGSHEGDHTVSSGKCFILATSFRAMIVSGAGR